MGALDRCSAGATQRQVTHDVMSYRRKVMERKRYVYWKDDDMWLGYLEEYPDYMTQGETLEELKENLRDIYHDLSSGNIPCVRRVDELEVA